ncbi:hypothetical protein BDV93DRAFT_563168 [Ceratobasidium sp. AG-I]|nr:hypothetical protein BDV93DRAFT_563168 [Ceratobasidium sp. AG-I]
MAGIMLRSLAASLSSERSPLPFIADPLAGIGCTSWSPAGTDDRALSVTGKTKHSPDSVRASPYPPLVRSASGYGSGAGAKRLAAAALTSRATSTPLRRTASLQGGDSLAALQAAADDAKLSGRTASCKPATGLHKAPRRSRTGSNNTPLRGLRPTPSFVNTLPLDVLVCPPPAPPVRCGLQLQFPTPRPAPVFVPETPPPAPVAVAPVVAQRRRSSLAPAFEAPPALVIRQVPLPSPPMVGLGKKKREPLVQRTLRRTFEKTPRGAQVKVLGAHAAVRMMGAMTETEAEDEAAVAASVVVVVEEDADVCMVDSWVELNEVLPISPSSPVMVEAVPIVSSQSLGTGASRGGGAVDEEMEWSMIDEAECEAGGTA